MQWTYRSVVVVERVVRMLTKVGVTAVRTNEGWSLKWIKAKLITCIVPHHFLGDLNSTYQLIVNTKASMKVELLKLKGTLPTYWITNLSRSVRETSLFDFYLRTSNTSSSNTLTFHSPQNLACTLIKHLYAPTSDSIVIQSSLTRSQASNLDDCWHKLYDTLWSASAIGLLVSLHFRPTQE